MKRWKRRKGLSFPKPAYPHDKGGCETQRPALNTERYAIIKYVDRFCHIKSFGRIASNKMLPKEG
jgi:hypothetical protein